MDTYDFSGDVMRFVSERYNRPDLLPVAKAIEYAEKHNYSAVLAYCGSAAVARRMVRELANGYQFEYPLEVKRLGPGRERVRLADSAGTRGSWWSGAGTDGLWLRSLQNEALGKL